jgi:hypothetical protein
MMGRMVRKVLGILRAEVSNNWIYYICYIKSNQIAIPPNLDYNNLNSIGCSTNRKHFLNSVLCFYCEIKHLPWKWVPNG